MLQLHGYGLIGCLVISIEIARLRSEIANLSEDMEQETNDRLALLPELLHLPVLFKRATLNQQHSILNRVSHLKM